MFKYQKGEVCGLQLKARHIDKIKFPPTDAMLYGIFFEYKITGYLPEGIEFPTLKGGGLPTKYVAISKQAETFKKTLERYGFEIVGYNKRYETDDMSLVVDIEVVHKDDAERRIIVIDTKCSALINDKWSDYGWHEERIEQKDDLLIQAVQYKYMYNEIYGYVPDFYFYVASSTNDTDCKFYKVEIDEETRFSEHLQITEKAKQQYDHLATTDSWKPRPSMSECADCAIKDTCKHFTDVPLIKTIHY